MKSKDTGEKTIRFNRYGNWYGYIGRNKVIAFVETPTKTQGEVALEWLNGPEPMTVMEEFGLMETHNKGVSHA